METKRFVDTVCRDLWRFKELYKVRLDDLGWELSDTAVSHRLKHRKPPPDLKHVGATLERLALDPEEFFAGVASGFHPELALAPFLAEDPEQFPRFRRRRLSKPPRRRYAAAELHEMAAGLESLRFVDADAAYDQAAEILRALGPDFVPNGATDDDAAEAWGVLGIVQRQRGQTSTTAGAYLQALQLGKAPDVRARTFQRIGMLMLYNGEDPVGAKRAINRARAIYLDAADDSGVGKTFIDEAIIRSLEGDYRQSRNLDRRALRYLAEDELENRFAAVQGIAVKSALLGETAEAVHFLDQASTFPANRPLMRTALHWLRAELAFALDQAGEALDHLGQALDAAEDAELAPVELVLLQLRMAKAYRLQGDHRALRWTLRDIVSSQRSFRSKSVHAALSELLAGALEDDATHVTAELLEETYRRMRERTTTAAVAPPLLT
jgi:tetratricopeptide (TPR) repeat protein